MMTQYHNIIIIIIIRLYANGPRPFSPIAAADTRVYYTTAGRDDNGRREITFGHRGLR